MRLAKNAFLLTLVMLTLVFNASAQTLRSEKDNRNTAPTVGTGGPSGGATGLFTVYDGQTLRRGEFTFSAAYSNFDRDPGDVDITEVPVSFQIGLSDNLELFFNTDAYRQVKVNSPANLSGFYLPNSQLFVSALGIRTIPGAIVLAPQGATNVATRGTAVYRRAGGPSSQFPFVGSSFGNNGFAANLGTLGAVFGFPNGTTPTIGTPIDNGNGAASFPGLGSVVGGILPGVVLQVQTINLNPTGPALNTTAPLIFTLAPSYLPDAPFVNRTYGQTAFSTHTIGAKFRITDVENPYGLALVPFYRFYTDQATGDDAAAGFNQLNRGASPGGGGFPFFGGGRGDIGLTVVGDVRARQWINISGNVGFIWNADPKGTFNGTEYEMLDRPNELQYAVGLDFPVNKYFQPIAEFRGIRYLRGTPNAFENHPIDAIAGIRIFPRRWFGMSFAYRNHLNQQDQDSIEDVTFSQSVSVVRAPGTPGATITVPSSSGSIFPAFRTSNNPHGFIFQIFAGRRNERGKPDVENLPANVTAVDLDKTSIVTPCPPGTRSTSGNCPDNQTVGVRTTAVDPENDSLTYSYTVSGGRITGQGANVTWDLSGVQPGTYTITSAVDDGCGFCGTPKSTTITVAACGDCVVPCSCPTISVTGPSTTTEPGGTMTFTANVSGGSQSSVTYNWSVSNGRIVEGQGTPTITVSTEGLSDTTITATVDIGGTDCNCTDLSDSETGVVSRPPTPTLQDEFGAIQNDDVKVRVDNFYQSLNADPNARGVIIIDGTNRDAARREKVIRDHIAFRGLDINRVTFVRGAADGELRTRFFVVPAGATDPQP